jgi:hypothetical protein
MGGTFARRGFDFQDHVAAGFLIEMVENVYLEEVWCESLDDITLIWRTKTEQQAEFLQVKSNELGTLWTVALLCKRDKGAEKASGKTRGEEKVGSSILERSLAHDRCMEPCRFRMVTCWEVNADLKVLTYPLFTDYRQSATKELDALSEELRAYVADFRSQNGNDCSYWARLTYWQVVGKMADVKNRNLIAFKRAIGALGDPVADDQLEEVYMSLVALASDAGAADWRMVGRDAKKIKRDWLIKWLRRKTGEYLHPVEHGGHIVREKMERASLPEDSILSALEERSRYLEQLYTPQYTGRLEYREIEGEVVSVLHSLRSKLDAGIIDDDGVAFHARCRIRLEEVRNEMPSEKRPPLAFVHGCMYNITDRCTHRFLRASA